MHRLQSSFYKQPSAWLKTILPVFFLIALISPQTLASREIHYDRKTQAYIDIPILYLTDRAEEGTGYGGTRKYIVNCKHDMYYGTAIVSVPQKEAGSAVDINAKLDWKDSNDKTKDFVQLDKIKTGDPLGDKAAFFQRLEKMIAQSGSKHICIFIHGAADPFDDAAQDAGMLAYEMQCPTILYSWPSVGPLKKYHVDEGNCEWTQQHFNTFWKDMESFAVKNPVQISLVAHSVGNRILARAVPVLEGTKLVADAELVSPDIDAEIFQHDMMHFQYTGVPVRLYSSQRDKVLSYTQMLYGGYYRLGENAGPAMIVAPHEQLVASLPNDGHAKRIDFTILDTKWAGHHFPFALVGSMSRFSSPPAGYMLAKAEAGKGNLYARYDSWRNDLKIPAADDMASCWKVVKQTEAKNTTTVGSSH